MGSLHESSADAVSAKSSEAIGEVVFSGPGAPSRWPAPALVPLVSTKMKSTALLLVSWTGLASGPGVVWISDTLLQAPPEDPVQPPGSLRVNA